MTVHTMMNEKNALVSVEGRIDSGTVSAFEEQLKGVMQEAETLVLDFEKVPYISSAALRILLSMQREMSAKGGMKLKNVNDTVMEILAVTGFASVLTIE